MPVPALVPLPPQRRAAIDHQAVPGQQRTLGSCPGLNAGACAARVPVIAADGPQAAEAQSSGVVYATDGRRLYVAVACDSWKARHIAASGRMAVTIPARRGGLLSLLSPSRPPPSASPAWRSSTRSARWRTGAVPEQVASVLPSERQASSRIIEILPEGQFMVCGLGVSLTQMRSRPRVPVGAYQRG